MENFKEFWNTFVTEEDGGEFLEEIAIIAAIIVVIGAITMLYGAIRNKINEVTDQVNELDVTFD